MLGRTHHRDAGLAHDRAHVFEVDIDHAGHSNDFRDAGHRLAQHFVGGRERLLLRDIVAQYFLQAAIENDNERVDTFRQHGDALFRHPHAPRAFELERLRYHADRQDAHFACHFGHHRRRAGAGAAPHAGSEEHHIGALERVGNDGAFAQGVFATDDRVAARAEAALAQLYPFFDAGDGQRLRIRIGADEFERGQSGQRHMVDRVAAGTANTDDFDDRLRLRMFVL